MDWSTFKPEESAQKDWSKFNDWSQFVPEAPKPKAEPRGIGGFLKDTGLDVAKGVVGFGESAVGFGDIATFGLVGKAAESIGYDPKQTTAFLSGLQSSARQKSDQEVADAKGFWNTLGALGTHPDVLFGNIVESLPGTIGAGAVGGLLVKKLAATAAAEATALGLKEAAASDFIANKVKEQAFKIAAAASAAEGVQTAGSIAESGRQSGKDWNEYVAPALAAGLGTAAIGMVSGKIGQKIGLGDIETDIAARTAGVKGVSTSQGGLFKRIGGEMLKEGALEEMPQSYQEKAFENLATGKPWQEGTNEAAAQGLMAGGGMAGGHSVMTGRAAPKDDTPAPVVPPSAPLQLGNTPDPMIAFPDGTVARRSEVDQYIANLPEDQQVAARAKLSGLAPQKATIEETAAAITSPTITSVDDAIAVSKDATSAPISGLTESTPTGEQELAQLVQSEQRNLQVMRAQMEQDRIKQAQIDQIPAIAAEQNATQSAVQRASELDAPTAMSSAFAKLFNETIGPETESIEPVPAPTPKPVPEPRIVDRTEGMIPVPRELADLRVAMNGGEVVRVQNRNGKFAYVVLPDESQPSLAKLANSPIPRTEIPNGPTIAPAGLDQPATPSPSDQPAGSGADSMAQRDDAGRGLSDTGVPVGSNGQADTVPLPSGVADSVAAEASVSNGTLAPIATTFPHTINPSGTVLVDGDPAAIRAAFPGVSGAVKFSDGKPVGVLFGVKSAPAVLDFLRTNQPVAPVTPQSTLNTPDSESVVAQPQGATSTKAESVAQESAPVQQVESSPLGRNNVPLAEGGKPYKTKMGADVARKNQPMMRTKRVQGGFVLVEKTPAQLAAQDKASKRLGLPRTSPMGEPIPAHAMIASEGGLSKDAQSDMGIDGNPKVGNRRLFSGTGGMTIEQATERLVEDGYLQEGATHNQAFDLIKRSLTNPQYTPEGFERMASKEQSARFEDYLTAEQDVSEDFDPFQSLSELGYEIEDAMEAGWSDATLELQKEVDALLSQAEAEGIDVDQIKADAVAQTEKGTQDDYLNAAKQGLQFAIKSAASNRNSIAQDGSEGRWQAAVAGSNQDSGQDDVGEGQAAEGLTAPTRADVLAQQDRAENAQALDNKAQIDAEASRQTLTQQSAPEQRKDTSGDMFGEEKAKLEAEKREADATAKNEASKDPNQSGLFDGPTEPTPSDQATAILDAANVTGRERLDAIKDVKDGLPIAELEKAYPAKIDDVGEKIGGSRKDTAVSTGPKRKTAAEDNERPTWAKRFQIAQVAGGFDVSVNGRDITGKWTISDTRNKDRFDQPKRVGDYYNTKEAAESALPLIAVAQKHRVAPTGQKSAEGGYTYEIWRDVNDRKRVKVVDRVFDSREEAMKYLAQNATEILETNATFGEADLPKPESTARVGVERRTGDVKGEDFRDAFGFRAVEFGLWNSQDERQEVMNAAYDGLMDLAEVLKVPPKAIGLNGDLALAFGARGKGLSGARAHYETDRVVMNLTKMNGAGALAHEWIHAFDHYLARQDGKTAAEWKINKDGTRSLDVNGGEADMASSGFRRSNSGVREELRAAYTSLVQSLFTKAEQYVEDTARADKFVAVSRGELQTKLDNLRQDLSEQKDVRYYKRNNKPASAEQLAEFDAMAAELVDGRGLATEWKVMPGKTRTAIQTRHTNETLEKLNELYKAVRGRSGFNAERRGVLDALTGYMQRYDQRLQMLREATALTPKTKRVPTSFAMDATSLDQGRGSDYWTTPHEMVARAFQGYVEDAIASKEGKSPFLNYGPENAGILTPWGAKRPYPAGDERKAMNAEFEKFIDVLETKETDKGVAMFSRSNSVSTGPGYAGDVVVRAINDRLSGSGNSITLVKTFTDLPQEVQDVSGDPDGLKGIAFGRGKVYIVQDQIQSRKELEEVIVHELYGHAGLRSLFGPDIYRRLNKLYLSLGETKIAELVKKYKLDVNGYVDHANGLTVSNKMTARAGGTQEIRNAWLTEEALAHIAEKETGTIKQIALEIVGAIRAWFRDNGFMELSKLGMSDIAHILKQARQAAFTGTGIMDVPMFSRSGKVGQTSPHSWDAPEASRFDDLVYKLQDKQIDTKRVTQAIRELSGNLADEKDVYLQEELYHGRAAARTEDFVNKELGPLITEMNIRGIDIATLDEYLHARHAEEANALIADRNPAIQDGGSGMTDNAAQDYFAKLPAEERKRLDAVAAKVDAILGNTRQMYADYGLESDATVKGWGSMFQHYVPLMREDKDGGMGIGQGFSIKGKEVKGRTGSTRKVVDILANIAMQRERAIVRGEKNRVANALVGLVASNPNPDFWQVGPPPMEKVYDPKTNSVVERQDPLYKSRDNVVVAKVKNADGTVKEVGVVFNEDNERAVRMAQSLKNLDATQLEGVLGVSAKISRYFAAVNTQYNPIFGVVNLARDFQGALLNLATTPLKGHAREIAGHTLSALKGIYLDARAARDGKPQTSAWAALWEDFQNEGGQTGYRDMFANSADRAKAIERELNPTKWMDSPLGKVFTANGTLKVPMAIAQQKAGGLFDWLSDYNLAMENAVRLSAYKVGLEQGMSKQQAASLGKNLTVNFNRKGQVGQQAGALYAFFNASMQGSARLGKTLFDMDGSDVKSIRLSDFGKKVVYGGMLLGTMQALLLAAAGFDDDEPPDFVRERSLIIPTGGKSYITIPMPLGLHVLPNMGRIPTEFVLGGFKKPEKHIAKLFGLTLDAFNPVGGGASLVQTLSPTAVDPLVALAENKDWTGKPIAKTSYNKATPGHALMKDTASYPSKLLAEAINTMTGGTKYTAGVWSPTPDQIDYLWGQATGGVGREASKAQQTGSAIWSGEDLPIHKVPLVGRFYGNAEAQSSQSNRFYSTINRLNEHEAEIKGLRKDNKGEELREYMQDNPEAIMFNRANAVELDVQRLRRVKREMIAMGAPRERIKVMDDRIIAKMAQFNESFRRVKSNSTALAQ